MGGADTGCEYQKAEIIGGHLGGCHHSEDVAQLTFMVGLKISTPTLEDSLHFLPPLKICLSYHLATLHQVYTRRQMNVRAPRDTHKNAYSSLIHNSFQLEMPKCPLTVEWINTRRMYPH